MASKSNIRSIRISDDMLEHIEQEDNHGKNH